MKKHLAWVKSHWLFVLLLVIAIVAFPVMFFVSSGMNAKNREAVEGDIRSMSQTLNQQNVSYSIEPLYPGAPSFSVSRPPNAATTTAVVEVIGQQLEQVQRAREALVEFNRNAFEPIVEGLFPEPAPAESVAKRDAMARRWVGWNAEYLRNAGAGSPPPADEVARRVEEKRLREIDRLLGVNPTADALTPEIADEIRKTLVNERVTAYSAPAQQRILFYADPSALASVAPYGGTSVPELETTWEWQWISWVNQMLIDAVRAANEPDLAVAYAPVKRIEKIDVSPLEYPAGSDRPVDDVTSSIQQSFESSLSGRTYDPSDPNALYDARYATVQLIVASKRIPEILDAFARSNLITALDLDIAEVSDLQELATQGYSFGGDHVVRVHLRLETLWLREWTNEFMPPSVRFRLRVQPPEGQTNANPAGEPADSGAAGRDRPRR